MVISLQLRTFVVALSEIRFTSFPGSANSKDAIQLVEMSRVAYLVHLN
jgi:hypothetical protein